MTLRRRFLALGLLALAAQAWALYSPGSPNPLITLPIPGLDKLVHLGLFAVPVWLFRRAGVRRRVVVPVAIAQVLVSEVVQSRWIPYRSGELGDAIADLAGIGLGLWLATRFSPATSRRTHGASGPRDETPPRADEPSLRGP